MVVVVVERTLMAVDGCGRLVEEPSETEAVAEEGATPVVVVSAKDIEPDTTNLEASDPDKARITAITTVVVAQTAASAASLFRLRRRLRARIYSTLLSPSVLG
jgi:hypothetical protein